MLHHLLIHTANIIYLASYAVKDIKVLRWLTIVGIVLLIPYYLFYSLWEAVAWNVVFLGINLFRLIKKEKNETQQAVPHPSPRHWLRRYGARLFVL